MQAGQHDRAETQQTFCSVSHPELLESPASAETVPAATGSRSALRTTSCTPTSCTPSYGVPAEVGG